jgi:hypothetical protein
MHDQRTLTLPPPPRPAYRRRDRVSIPRILGYAALPLSVLLILLWYIAVAITVTTAGVERPATVADKDVVRGRRSTVYWVYYDYVDPRGQVRGRSPASWEVWDNLRRGSPVKVRAVRFLGLPRSEIIGSGDPLINGSFYALVAITIGCMALTFIAFASVAKPVLRRRAIIRNGTLATGHIVSKSFKRLPKGSTIRTVTYEYTGSGTGHTRATMRVTAEEYARVHEGDAVPVVFIDGEKDNSILYGFGEYVAADDWGNELAVPAGRV